MADAWNLDLANMTDEEWQRFYLSLSPAERIQLMGSYTADTPEIPGATGSISGLMAPNPDVDTKGNIEPWDLSNQAQAWNYLQDQGQSLMSPMGLIMGGPGSYDPSVFQARTVYSGPQVDTSTPGLDRVTQLAAMGGGSWDSYLAEAMLNDKLSPAAASAQLQNLILDSVNNPDVADDPEIQALLNSLPMAAKPVDPFAQSTMTEDQAKLSRYDLSAILPFAQELGKGLTTDPTSAAGYYDPASGITYANAPEQQYSKIAQQFIDAGLPFPTERYDDPARLDAIAPVMREQFDRATAAKDENIKYHVAQSRLADQNATDLQKAYDEWQTAVGNYRPAGTGGGGGGAGARGPEPVLSGAGQYGMTEGAGAYGGAGARGPDEQGTSLYGQELFPGWAQAKDNVVDAAKAYPGAMMDAWGYADNAAVLASPTARLGWLAALAGKGIGNMIQGGGGGGGGGGTVEKGFNDNHAPAAPTLFRNNGQWSTDVPEVTSSPNFQAFKADDDYAPVKSMKLNSQAVQDAKRKQTREQYLADRAKNQIGVRIGGKTGYYQAPGTLERIYADAQAANMVKQGRTPLSDAYMQRLMGMQGFGIR